MRMFWSRPARRWGVLVVLLGLLGGGCGGPERRPDVVLIVIDTLRQDRLSCYGHDRATSPNLDRLAADGVLYERAVSTAPWTLPSHASMFTGLPPSRHRTHHEHLNLTDDHATLAEHLRDAGYETMGVSNNPWITERMGMTQGFESYHEPWRDRVSGGRFDLNIFVDPGTHGMVDAGAADTEALIGEWLDARDDARPYFLFVNLIEVHGYYDPPEAYRNRFTDEPLDRHAVKAVNLAFHEQAYADSLQPELLDRIGALYDGEIAYVDDWIGRFVGDLRERGRLDDTMIIVTSDHGEAFGEYRSCSLPIIDHQLSVHDVLLDVPLLIHYPRGDDDPDPDHGGGLPPAGHREPGLVSSVDLVPTVLDVVGAAVPDSLDGVSLAAGPPSPDRVLFSEYYRPVVHLGLLHNHVEDRRVLGCLIERRLVAAHDADETVILSSRDGVVAVDPATGPAREVSDVTSVPDGLRSAAEARLTEMESGPSLSPPKLDEAVDAALRSLGYIQ